MSTVVKNKVRIALTALAICVVGALSFSASVCAKASGESVLDSVASFTMKTGASVKLDTKNGIRFGATVTRGDYDALAAAYSKIEFGTFIMPKQYESVVGEINYENCFGTNALYTWGDYPGGVTEDNGKYVILHAENTVNVGESLVETAGAVVDMKVGNLAIKYTGLSYVKATDSGGGVFYKFARPDDNARSMLDVAIRAIDANRYSGDDLTALNGYITRYDEWYKTERTGADGSYPTYSYSVEIYKADADGVYGAAERSQVTGNRVNSTVTLTPEAIDGYYFDAENSGNVLSGKVYADDDTVLKAYYGVKETVTVARLETYSAAGTVDLSRHTSISAPTKVEINGAEAAFTATDGIKVDSSLFRLGEDNMVKIYKNAKMTEITAFCITKTITTADELLNLAAYGGKTDETTIGDLPAYKYGGYFELGNNVILTGRTVATTFWGGDFENQQVRDYGFTGTFDGKGFTVYGGTYGVGGLFGAIAKEGVLKNTAFVNATISAGDNTGVAVLGHCVCGTVDNILIDVIAFEGNGVVGSAFAANLFGATVTNSVAYFNAYKEATTGFTLYAWDGIREWIPKTVGTNLYCITLSPTAFNNYLPSPDFAVARYDMTATCDRVGFNGLDAGADGYWDLTGDKAMFKSVKDIKQPVVDGISIPKNTVKNGDTIVLPTLPEGVSASIENFAGGDSSYATLNGNEITVATDIAGGFTFNVVFTWNNMPLVTAVKTVTVEKIELTQIAKQYDYELYSRLTAEKERVANTADLAIDLTGQSGIDRLSGIAKWTLENTTGYSMDVTASVTVNGSTVTLAAPMSVDSAIATGAYSLSGENELGSFKLRIPVLLVNKIITTADELLNFERYGESYAVNGGTAYKGYFILGGNIDLTGRDVNAYESYGDGDWQNALSRSWGLDGTFDGRGYTVYGGSYANGGLFGAISTTGTVKNVAFVNASLQGHATEY